MTKPLMRALIIGIASLFLPLSFAAAQTLPAICSVQPDLSQGASGNSVSTLQAFLESEGYFTEQPTGFFGPATEAALVAFQNATGITAEAGGSGIFGAFTQTYIASHFCTGSGTSVSDYDYTPQSVLEATPNSGAAPLIVTFSGVGPSISFGDTSSQASSNGADIGDISHTFTSPGIYDVTSGDSAVTVTVGGTVGSTSGQTPNASMTAPNNSGPAPLSVTFYISCTQGSGYDMVFGDGTDLGSSGVSQSQCNGSLQAVSHTYQNEGSYTAQLEVFVAQENGTLAPVSVDSTTITVGVPASSTTTTTTTTTSPSSSTPTCVALLNNDLVQNDTDATTNGDVSRLQRFLSLYPAIYPSGLVTGLYGPLTAAAVSSFQSTYGNPPQCASLGFTATPTSGTAPLTVTLSAQNLSELYSLNFGDSSTGNFTSITPNGAATTYSTTHTYASAGTYYPELEFGTTTQNAVGIAMVTVAAPPPTPTPTTSATPTATSCYPTQTGLQLGSSDSSTGGNVTILQNFLISMGYLSAGDNTGYFGSATQAAVIQFQTQSGIQPTGYVGAYTVNEMEANCNNTVTNKAPFSFTVSPASGASPLTVTFTLSGISNNTNVTHIVAFGDNTNSQMTYQGSNGSTGTWTASHIYGQDGTYTATLLTGTNICGGVVAYGCVSDLQVGSTVVTVSGGVSGTASPASSSSGTTGTSAASSCTPVTGGSCQGASGTYPNYGAESLATILNNPGGYGINNEALFSCVNGVWMCESSSCNGAQNYYGGTYAEGGAYSFSATPVDGFTIPAGLQQCTQ